MIHPTAQVDPDARIADDVEIGAWTVVGADVEIASGTSIGSHCSLKGPTLIGPGNEIFPFCSIGDDPQDKKFDPAGESRLVIGSENKIREYVSINRGTAGGGGTTRVGDDNLIMAYCHIAHDCQIGNHTIFANNATLAGHVEVDDFAILGGFTGVHQFCRVGESSFSAISAVIVRDVPPFVMVDGNTARPRSINREGLKRRGFSADSIASLKRAYRTLYREGLTLEVALERIEQSENGDRVGQMLAFIRASERGIVR